MPGSLPPSGRAAARGLPAHAHGEHRARVVQEEDLEPVARRRDLGVAGQQLDDFTRPWGDSARIVETAV